MATCACRATTPPTERFSSLLAEIFILAANPNHLLSVSFPSAPSSWNNTDLLYPRSLFSPTPRRVTVPSSHRPVVRGVTPRVTLWVTPPTELQPLGHRAAKQPQSSFHHTHTVTYHRPTDHHSEKFPQTKFWLFAFSNNRQQVYAISFLK